MSLTRMHADDVENALLRVSDQRERADFAIPTQPHLAVDVYHHQLANRDFSTFDCEDIWMAP